MNKSDFYPISVSELLSKRYNFSIPSYQRGYRWEEKQVEDLLEDIFQFCNDKNSGSSYYLQPLVVKPAGDKYEVLDGQQRLTTLMLLLDYLREKEFNDSEKEELKDQYYTIEYQSRPNLDFNNIDMSDNIDSFYIGKSKAYIRNWFAKKRAERRNVAKIKECLFYAEEKQVKFIWYEVDENSADLNNIQIFNRLNKGKISLTSSELIKALFLLDLSKIHSGDEASSKMFLLDSEQLSLQWNETERKLENDDFWYFLSDDDPQTRMDLLFDFTTRKKTKDSSDYAYREFQNLYNYCRDCEKSGDVHELSPLWQEKGITTMREAWELVIKNFNLMESWYEDNMHYHNIGFLVATGSNPLEIHDKIESAKKGHADDWTIDDTENEFKNLIREKFKVKKSYLTPADIDDLEYSDHERAKRLLLLFNTETCRKSKAQRFNFKEYKDKKSNWDLEHIDSQNEHTVQTIAERLEWIDLVLASLEQEPEYAPLEEFKSQIIRECNRLKNIGTETGEMPKEDFNNLYINIQKFNAFDPAAGDKDVSTVNLEAKNKHSISNLALLKSNINRSYQDAPFSFKRSVIIDADKAGSDFIPVCTRNVFLKYYSKSNKNVSFLERLRWNSIDKKDYLSAIHETLDPIFDTNSNHEEIENE